VNGKRVECTRRLRAAGPAGDVFLRRSDNSSVVMSVCCAVGRARQSPGWCWTETVCDVHVPLRREKAQLMSLAGAVALGTSNASIWLLWWLQHLVCFVLTGSPLLKGRE